MSALAAATLPISQPAFAIGCKAPDELVKLQAPLPKLTAAVASGAPITIVALGSSSTSGTGATSRDRAYPARMQEALRKAWPESDVRVVNAGVAGQLARDMLARMDRHVLPHKPHLVIWQTGVNDAIRGVPIERLKNELRTGIARIRAAGADVVLINQQFYPRFAKVKRGHSYLMALREVAEETRVPVVRRFAIMQHLIESAQFTAATLLSADQFHLNDRSYDCLGRLLARSLSAAAAPRPAPAAEGTPAAAVKHEASM